MYLVNQSFSIAAFEDYINKLKFNGWTPNFIVVHNTSVPNQALYKKWHEDKSWYMERWGKNLASYYAGMGWNGCPHFIVGYDKILVLNDPTRPGTHTPSWNKFTWGVETIAEFENEPFADGVKENLIGALAILHERVGLNPTDFKLGVRGLHFHKEDKATTHKTCPGKNLIKADLVKAVFNKMNEGNDGHFEPTIEAQESKSINLSIEEATSISTLQLWLSKSLKKDIRADGILGPITKAAVKEFQQLHNLKVDGIAGPVTRSALKLTLY